MEFRLFQRRSDYSEPYRQLLAQHRLWQKLSALIKKRLPENLAPHYRVACLEGDTLVIFADNSIIANRLKMLMPAMLDNWADKPAGIHKIHVKLSPTNTAPERKNTLRLSRSARQAFEHTAGRLTSRHPELAAALQRLAQQKNER